MNIFYFFRHLIKLANLKLLGQHKIIEGLFLELLHILFVLLLLLCIFIILLLLLLLLLLLV